jgi:uncharacterized lipoprotein
LMDWVLPASVVLLATVTVSCGVSEERKNAYRNAESIEPIEMPAGLKMTQGKESLVIPKQTATKLASVDELELPPKIVDSATLDVLDDDSSSSENKENEKQKQAKVKPVSVNVTRNSNGDSILLVDSEFDHVWPLVKPALVELGFTIDDSSRGTEMYVISKDLPELRVTDEPIHPGDVEEEVKEEYQIHVKPAGEQTQITVHNKLGQLEGSGLAEHLLLQIKQVMENPKQTSSTDS